MVFSKWILHNPGVGVLENVLVLGSEGQAILSCHRNHCGLVSVCRTPLISGLHLNDLMKVSTDLGNDYSKLKHIFTKIYLGGLAPAFWR